MDEFTIWDVLLEVLKFIVIYLLIGVLLGAVFFALDDLTLRWWR